MSVDQAMSLAKEQVQSRNWQTAEQLCRQILAAEPNHPEALHLMGGLAMNVGRMEIAVELFRRALLSQPNSAEIQYNLGVALVRVGRTLDAAGAFHRVVQLRPDHLAARGNLAATLVAMNRFEEGIEVCRATLAMAPDHPDAWNNLGVALQKVGRLDEAIVAFERSVAARPDSVETLSNLGNNLAKVGRFNEAISAHQRAISLRPNSGPLHNDLGCAFYDAGRYEEAIDAFHKALSAHPGDAHAQCTLAISLHRAARFDEAISEGRKAIFAWRDSPLPKFNLAMMLLLRGEFEEGWPLNEARLDCPSLNLPHPVVGKAVWDGSDLNGKAIVLYGEQGLGDFIQFIRYLPMVRECGGRIILGCAPEMIRLARQLEGVERLVTTAREDVHFDEHAPLLSLPGIFKTDLSNIPTPIPYLKADAELSAKWRSRMPEDPKVLKVGLCWAGRPTHGDDRNRSLKLNALAALGKAEGVWICSLQKGDAAAQAKNPPEGMKIECFSDDIEDFADTAAIIDNLDLVISVDTVVAHLAGAMGKPTWILIPRVPDWRWLLDRLDSPWYPTVRLFRQPRLRDWGSAVNDVARALNEEAAHKRG